MMQLDTVNDKSHTEIGGYFVANHPPFSAWTPEQAPSYVRALDTPADDSRRAPLGLYIHIPLFRKCCKFCCFRVYTDKNSSDVDGHPTALAREAALYADRSALRERNFDFVYFGGGDRKVLRRGRPC